MWGATECTAEEIAAQEISIHAPRVGSDPVAVRFPCISTLFQSTLPVWGATNLFEEGEQAVWISIHAPRVGSDRGAALFLWCLRDFNPRSPCGERRVDISETVNGLLFQSTLPVWGATPPKRKSLSLSLISIHAPRVGSDTNP